VTAPAAKKPEAKLVVTNAKEMADAMYAYYSSFSPKFEIQYKGNTQRIEQLVEEAYENAIKRDDYVYGHISKHSIRFEYGGRTATIF
ncbi:transglutaminase domain-containing protein, partial [Bacillus cereus group sp. Bc237]